MDEIAGLFYYLVEVKSREAENEGESVTEASSGCVRTYPPRSLSSPTVPAFHWPHLLCISMSLNSIYTNRGVLIGNGMQIMVGYMVGETFSRGGSEWGEISLDFFLFH